MVRNLAVNKVNGDVRYEVDLDGWELEDDEEYFAMNLRGAESLHDDDEEEDDDE